VIQLLIAMVVYTVSAAIVFESLSYLFKNLSKLTASEKKIEDFEYVMAYLNNQMKNSTSFKIEKGVNWTALLIEATPVLGFEIFHGKDLDAMRRIVGKSYLHFSNLQNMEFGLGFLSGKNFEGFNTIYQGEEKMDFERDGTHLLFRWGKRWVYLM
jgi:hypothetical protein